MRLGGSIPLLSTNNNLTKMKSTIERRVDEALKLLLQTLTQNVNDTRVLLNEYEATHDDIELEEAKQYRALVAGHFEMKQTIERINKQLNK